MAAASTLPRLVAAVASVASSCLSSVAPAAIYRNNFRVFSLAAPVASVCAGRLTPQATAASRRREGSAADLGGRERGRATAARGGRYRSYHPQLVLKLPVTTRGMSATAP